MEAVVAIEIPSRIPVGIPGVVAGRGQRLEGIDTALGFGNIGKQRGGRIGNLQRQPLELPRLGIGLVAPAVDAEQKGAALARLPQQLQPSTEHVIGPEFIAAGVTLLPFVGLGRAQRRPGREGLGESATDERFPFELVEAPIGAAHTGLELLGRLGGDIVDGTAGGVLAKQQPLWALEDFHPLQIEGGTLGEGTVGQGYLIHVDTHRRARPQGVIVEAHAPQGKQRRAVLAGGEGQAGADLHQIAGVPHADFRQLVPRCGGNGHPHFVDGLGSLLGGDDDLLEGR